MPIEPREIIFDDLQSDEDESLYESLSPEEKAEIDRSMLYAVAATDDGGVCLSLNGDNGWSTRDLTADQARSLIRILFKTLARQGARAQVGQIMTAVGADIVRGGPTAAAIERVYTSATQAREKTDAPQSRAEYDQIRRQSPVNVIYEEDGSRHLWVLASSGSVTVPLTDAQARFLAAALVERPDARGNS